MDSAQVDERRVKVRFGLPQDEDGWPPVGAETMWATPVADGYEIANIPFFVFDLALRDLVEVKLTAARFGEVVRLVRRGGHRTVRVLPADVKEWQSFSDDLEHLGCETEW